MAPTNGIISPHHISISAVVMVFISAVVNSNGGYQYPNELVCCSNGGCQLCNSAYDTAWFI